MAQQEPTLNEKADMVAETTIKSNPHLNAANGRDQLKEALSEKLVQSHEQGKLDLDKFIDQERGKDRADRGEGRSR